MRTAIASANVALALPLAPLLALAATVEAMRRQDEIGFRP